MRRLSYPKTAYENSSAKSNSFYKLLDKKNNIHKKIKRAHSPMVEHVVCNDEIRVRFPMGPFLLMQKFTNHTQNKTIISKMNITLGKQNGKTRSKICSL